MFWSSSMRAASNVIPPTLLYWPMATEVDVGGMTVEVQPSHQYCIAFCCHVADGQYDTMASDMEVHIKQKCHWISTWEKACSHWPSSRLAELLLRSNTGCGHNEVMGGAFQQWWQQQWVTFAGADCYKHSVQALVHPWWICIANSGDYAEEECFVAENLLR